MSAAKTAKPPAKALPSVCWEYSTLNMTERGEGCWNTPVIDVDQMNEAGRAGWELVQILPNGASMMAVFKRLKVA